MPMRLLLQICTVAAYLLSIQHLFAQVSQDAPCGERFVESLRASSVAIEDWTDAVLEWQQAEKHGDANFRVAFLKNQEKQVGYILFLDHPEEGRVAVAFSGSDYPDDLDGQLKLAGALQEACPDAAGVLEDVMMVPTVTSHGVPLVSPLDAAASSVLNYWQLIKGRYLFDHVFILDPRTDLPFPRLQSLYPAADVITDYPALPPDIPEDPNQQRLEWRKHWNQVVGSAAEEFRSPPGQERSPTREIAEAIRMFEGINTIAKKWLGSNLMWPTRQMVAKDERRLAGNMFNWTDPAPSPLVADAFLVGKGYLAGAETPEMGIDHFLRTRAAPLKCRKDAFEASREIPLPGILLNPEGRAYVLVGRIEIQNECWAVVVDPVTVRPIVRKLKDRLACVRRAQGRPAAESQPTRHPLPAKEIARRRAEDEILLSDCPMSGSPDAAKRGLHYIRSRLLQGWTVLTVIED